MIRAFGSAKRFSGAPAAGTVDIQADVLVRILAFEEKQLSHNQIGVVFIDFADQKYNALLEQSRVDIIRALAATAGFHHHWHQAKRLRINSALRFFPTGEFSLQRVHRILACHKRWRRCKQISMRACSRSDCAACGPPYGPIPLRGSLGQRSGGPSLASGRLSQIVNRLWEAFANASKLIGCCSTLALLSTKSIILRSATSASTSASRWVSA